MHKHVLECRSASCGCHGLQLGAEASSRQSKIDKRSQIYVPHATLHQFCEIKLEQVRTFLSAQNLDASVSLPI